MRFVVFASLVLTSLVVGLAACQPLYPDHIAPKDAKFGLSCIAGCGESGADKGVGIDVSFAKGAYSRQISFCCRDRAAILAELQTVADWWCDGLDVPPQKVGGLTIATNISATTGQRGVTLDAGEGFVAFNCDAWLPQLIEQMKATACCPVP